MCPRTGYWRILGYPERVYLASGKEFPIIDAVWYFDLNQNVPNEINESKVAIHSQSPQ